MPSFGNYIGYTPSPENTGADFGYLLASGVMSLSDTVSHEYSPTSFSLFSATNSSASTINMPAGIRAGDIALFCAAAVNTNTTIPTYSLPAGWNLGKTVSGTSTAPTANYSYLSSIFYKTLDGSETSVSGSSSSSSRGALLIFRPTSPIRTLTIASEGEFTADATVSRNHTFTSSTKATKLEIIHIFGGGTPTYSESPSLTTAITTSSVAHIVRYGVSKENDISLAYTLTGHCRTVLTLSFD